MNRDSEFLTAVKSEFGFTPDYNKTNSQYSAFLQWSPIYAKFSLLGKKISHFEMYFAPGAGVTRTTSDRFTKHAAVGQRFYITEHFIFRLEYLISWYSDEIPATRGSASKAKGGPGFTASNETTHNMLIGLGWIF